MSQQRQGRLRRLSERFLWTRTFTKLPWYDETGNHTPTPTNVETAPDFPDTPQPEGLVELRLQDNFFKWMALGEGRSFKAVATTTNMPVAVVIKHAQKFKWKQRLALVQSRASAKTLDRMVESYADVNEIHVRELRELRENALSVLRNIPITHPRDAIKLVLESMKLERQILGLDADSDNKDLTELLAEKLKRVQAKVLPEEEGPKQIEHEFEFNDALTSEPLELLPPVTKDE